MGATRSLHWLDEQLRGAKNSEALIQDATERLMQGRTTIVIAHRLSTVPALTRILIFDRGRIIEEGDHHALIGREKASTAACSTDKSVVGITHRKLPRQPSRLCRQAEEIRPIEGVIAEVASTHEIGARS